MHSAIIKITLATLSVLLLLSCTKTHPNDNSISRTNHKPKHTNQNGRHFLAIPTPALEALYSYTVNGAYKGTYQIRYSTPFQFNEDTVFTATSTFDKIKSARMYRLSDHAYLGTLIDNKVHIKAQPYELVYSRYRQTHNYLWHDYSEDKTYPIQQQISLTNTLQLQFNQQVFDASEMQSVFTFNQQRWLRRTIWLNKVGIIYSQHIQNDDSVEEHQLITLKR